MRVKTKNQTERNFCLMMKRRRRKRKLKRMIVKMRRRKMIGRVKSPRNQEKMIVRMRVKTKNQRRRRNVMTLIQTITSLLLRRKALLKSLKEMILKMNRKTNDHHELRALRENLSIKMNLMSRKMKNQQRKQSQSQFKRSDVQEANLAVILMALDKHLAERRRRRLLLLIQTLILTSTWQIVIGHQSRVNPTDPIKVVDDPHQTSARNHLAKRERLHLALALTIQILMMTEEREEVAEENQAKVRSQKRRKRAVTIHTLKMIIALMIPGRQRRRRVEDQKAAVVVVVDICKK